MTTVNLDICGSDLIWIIKIIRIIIRIIQIAAPLALIIFGSLDFFKAIIAGDEKEMKMKRKPFIGRLIAAVIILLMPMIVSLVMKTVARNSNNRFAECWNAAGGQDPWSVTITNGTNTDDWLQ